MTETGFGYEQALRRLLALGRRDKDQQAGVNVYRSPWPRDDLCWMVQEIGGWMVEYPTAEEAAQAWVDLVAEHSARRSW